MQRLIIAALALIPVAFAPADMSDANDADPFMQFARLVGNWSIRDEALQPDGTWQAGPGAEWKWYTILDGKVIQDDWISPPPGAQVKQGQRVYGTNLRVWNPAESHWEMAWASNLGGKIDTFTATARGEDVVMRGHYAGADTRITFFDVSANSFSWKMEQRKDEAGEWREVYRIFGRRMP